jgi:DNA-binding MarR family transcriptional regulator
MQGVAVPKWHSAVAGPTKATMLRARLEPAGSTEISVTRIRQLDRGTPSLGEVLDFVRLVSAVDCGLQAMTGEMDAVFGVTSQQRLVLRVLSKYPLVSAGDLGEVLGMNRAPLATLLKTLEEAGYISRKVDPEDRRRTLISLTRRGVRVSEAHASTVEAAVRKVLGKVTSRTVDSAKLVLSALASELAGSEPEGLRARSKA